MFSFIRKIIIVRLLIAVIFVYTIQFTLNSSNVKILKKSFLNLDFF